MDAVIFLRHQQADAIEQVGNKHRSSISQELFVHGYHHGNTAFQERDEQHRRDNDNRGSWNGLLDDIQEAGSPKGRRARERPEKVHSRAPKFLEPAGALECAEKMLCVVLYGRNTQERACALAQHNNCFKWLLCSMYRHNDSNLPFPCRSTSQAREQILSEPQGQSDSGARSASVDMALFSTCCDG